LPAAISVWPVCQFGTAVSNDPGSSPATVLSSNFAYLEVVSVQPVWVVS